VCGIGVWLWCCYWDSQTEWWSVDCHSIGSYVSRILSNDYCRYQMACDYWVTCTCYMLASIFLTRYQSINKDVQQNVPRQLQGRLEVNQYTISTSWTGINMLLYFVMTYANIFLGNRIVKIWNQLQSDTDFTSITSFKRLIAVFKYCSVFLRLILLPARRYAIAQVFATATCPSVCPSVASRYCVKTKKASVMISSPFVSPMILHCVPKNMWLHFLQ